MRVFVGITLSAATFKTDRENRLGVRVLERDLAETVLS